jgi:hypothetical protein
MKAATIKVVLSVEIPSEEFLIPTGISRYSQAKERKPSSEPV